jgi:hypothetical protein
MLKAYGENLRRKFDKVYSRMEGVGKDYLQELIFA